MFALVNPDTKQVFQTEPTLDDTFPVAPPLAWVECPETVKPGYSYTDGAFAPPPPPPPPVSNTTSPIELL